VTPRAEPFGVDSYLEPGEEIRLNARPHGVALARPFARALIAAGAGGVCIVLGSSVHWGLAVVGAAALALAALVALAAVWQWDRTEVVLTTEKLFVVYGILRRRAAAVRLDRIQTIEVEQGLVGRVLGYGTLVAGDLEIPYVARPRDVYGLLR
jgi:uncharacterized membrane protein YdbT with pleckstrin-like domain